MLCNRGTSSNATIFGVTSSLRLEDDMEKKRRQPKTFSEKGSSDRAGGPDTTSFMSFIYSFLSCSEAGFWRPEDSEGKDECNIEMNEQYSTKGPRNVGSRKRQSTKSKCFSGKNHHQGRSSPPSSSQDDAGNGDEVDWHFATDPNIKSEKGFQKSIQQDMLLEMSEPSLLLSKHFSSDLCSALPTLAQGRKWVLLYSTWKHGISLHTLYRRSTLCPGPCLLVVGDRQGAVFGGLLAGPLSPTSSKKYQGTTDSFVFTNVSGTPVLFRPTGVNRYFTLCSTDSLALGGGGHFALYLDGDLLHGSSSSSETFGNSCLAHTEDFELKDVELWGFAYATKYSVIAASYSEPQEAPGICRWLD